MNNVCSPCIFVFLVADNLFLMQLKDNQFESVLLALCTHYVVSSLG